MTDRDSQDTPSTLKPLELDEKRWRELLPLFDHAMDLEPDARETWLKDLDQHRPQTAASLRALLTADEQLEAQHFLEEGAALAAASVSLKGCAIGAYTIEQPIGEGGMGEVWRARRSDGRFERKVAVKLLHAALVSRHARERFEREGRLLARLTHPNIAPLVDAGVTPENRPYIVLEYLEGQPIDRYCDTRALGIEARLRLFQDVLAALTHAHDNLIIHRDLKPSNVLVTSAGVVKLLDFGIAKLMDPSETHATQPPLTVMAEAPFTPDYAAPEQILGEPVSAATDVYQLGALLYALLCGAHPYARHGMGKRELLKIALDIEPPLMSDMVTRMRTQDRAGLANRAQRRGLTWQRLRTTLRGDLDAILAKALRKDPAERYGSAVALAGDIARYLSHQPVVARSGAWRYRARKFLRRNRMSVAVGGVAALMMIGATVFSVTQMNEARKQRDEARLQSDRVRAQSRFNNMMLNTVGEGGRPLKLEEMLDNGVALLEKEYLNDPEFVVDSLIGLSGRYMDIGNRHKERAALVKAEAIARTLGPDLLAEVECDTVETEIALGDLDSAARRLSEGQAALAQISSPRPGLVSDCLNAEAALHSARGRMPEAIASAEKAAALLVETGRVRTVRYPGVLSHIELLYASTGNIAKAREINGIRQLVEQQAGVSGAVPLLRARHNEALYFEDVGEVREALARERDVVNRSTSKDGNPLHPTISEAYGAMLLRMEQPAAALPWLDQAIQAWHTQSATARELAVQALRSRALLALGRAEAARKELPDLSDLAVAANQSSRQSFVRGGTWRADVLLALGDSAGARAQIEAVIRAMRAASDCARWEIGALLTAARVAEAERRHEDAGRYAAQALESAQKRAFNADRSADVGEALLILGRVRRAEGELVAAARLFQRARTILTSALGEHHSLTRAASAATR